MLFIIMSLQDETNDYQSGGCYDTEPRESTQLFGKEAAIYVKIAQTICFQAVLNAFPKGAKQKLILFSVRPGRIELCCDAMAKANR